MNLMEVLNKGYYTLKSNKIKSYKIDAELLLSDSLNIRKEELILNLRRNIKIQDYKNFLCKLQRRKVREPIAYILKKKEFWKNEFYIDKNVLIPRPETEHLIDETLKIIPLNKSLNLLEIGIGSGCIIISILKERKKCSAIGIDCCKKAIKTANFNANLHQIKNRIKILKTNVDNFKTGKYDLIVSNPPYIDKRQLKYLGVSEYEPLKALNGGTNGIEILMKVILRASQLLKINGKLIIEIGYNQKYKVIKLLKKNNFFVNKIVKDFSNIERCIVSTKLN
tara:strand:- start:1778 stop:2617 length:840 start_codon:yes stop_codon:yes gene_type:complete